MVVLPDLEKAMKWICWAFEIEYYMRVIFVRVKFLSPAALDDSEEGINILKPQRKKTFLTPMC